MPTDPDQRLKTNTQSGDAAKKETNAYDDEVRNVGTPSIVLEEKRYKNGTVRFVLTTSPGEARDCDNPRGLSLAGIYLEAFESFAAFGESRELDEQIDLHANSVSNITADTLIRVKRRIADPTPKHLIQPKDENLARLIKKSPAALLCWSVTQDALARWNYAVHVSTDSQTKKQAKALLKTAIPPRRGNPGAQTINPIQLKVAYDDLVEYCSRVKKMANKTQSAEAVIAKYPEVNDLNDYGLVLAKIIANRLQTPSPSEIATTWFKNIFKIAPSTVFREIKKATL